MGGVDLSDQKVSVDDFDCKSTKWWKKVSYKIQMSAAINAHIFLQAIAKNSFAEVFGKFSGTARFDWSQICSHQVESQQLCWQ